MTQLLNMFGFLSVILRGLVLAFEALTVGGVIFCVAIARGRVPASLLPRVTRWLVRFAALLAVTQISIVAANSAILTGSTDLSWRDVSGAGFWFAGKITIFGSACVVVFARTRLAVAVFPLASGLVLAGSVMQSHAVARVEHRAILIALTFAHHLGADAWIGGIFYLLVTLRQSLENAVAAAITSRFSKLAMVSVGILVAAGFAVSVLYIGSVPAAAETTYGIMVLAKLSMTVLLLGLGALNLRIVRSIRSGFAPDWLPLRRFAEAELGVGLTVLLAAASLTSTPPAVDVQADRVTAHEIAERIQPRWPRLDTPPLQDLSPATPLAPQGMLPESFVPGQQFQPDTPADMAWSEFNHHWAGLIVLATGILALLARRFSWARHWPLLFLGLAVFLLIRSDAENWPLGPRGFWESFQVPEVAQHRVFVLLTVAFGLFEWAVRNNRISSHWPSLIFPMVCAVGGALLMTHSHSLGNVKQEFLAELSHVPLALLAVVAGWSRWLEIRLPRDHTRPAMWIWPLCFVLIGAVLLGYRES